LIQQGPARSMSTSGTTAAVVRFSAAPMTAWPGSRSLRPPRPMISWSLRTVRS